MPHLSKNKVSEDTQKAMEKRIFSFINDTSPRTRREIFSELFTKTERIMLAKRLSIIFLISKRKTAYEISGILKVSDSTIFRFMNMIEKGAFKKNNYLAEKEFHNYKDTGHYRRFSCHTL